MARNQMRSGRRRENAGEPPYGPGGGRGRRRGRRMVGALPPHLFYGPRGIPLDSLEVVTMRVEEVEALRLCDVLGLNQEEAAERMGISRRTLWTDLKSGRFKIVSAILEGKAIQILGGDFILGSDAYTKR